LEQSDLHTSFSALKSRIAEKTGGWFSKLFVKKKEDPAIAYMLLVRRVIVDVANGRRGISGRIQCPVCRTGQVSYWVLPNSYIHAECSSPECVHWME
jgi:hypothetical protein